MRVRYPYGSLPLCASWQAPDGVRDKAWRMGIRQAAYPRGSREIG